MRPLSGTLARALPGRAWAGVEALARVQRAWPGIVGGLLAMHATPIEVRGEVLVVAADHALFAAQLREQSRLVLRALRRAGARGLARIRVVIAPERVRARAAEIERAAPVLPPPTLAECRAAARVVAAVADRGLRRAMFRALLAQMRAKRLQESGNGARS